MNRKVEIGIRTVVGIIIGTIAFPFFVLMYVLGAIMQIGGSILKRIWRIEKEG